MKNDLEALQKELSETKKELEKSQAERLYLKEQLEWLKRQLFGKKSEKIVKSLDEEQLSFEGFEIEEKLEPESKVVSAHTRAKPNRQGQDALVIPDDFPKEVIVLDLSEEEKKSAKLREALGYVCSLIPYLKNYLNHSEARLDNNPAERALRAIAMGRKNWLFFGSPTGATSGAIIFSLVQTCKHLDINPATYLEDVMRWIMSHPASNLDQLLPDQWKKTREPFIRNMS